MASATEMLTNGLENSWKLELGDVSTCTGNDDGGMEKACPGTTTGISGLTDSPSDEKFETLRAIPFLSCFLKKKKNSTFESIPDMTQDCTQLDVRRSPKYTSHRNMDSNPHARTEEITRTHALTLKLPTGGLSYISRDKTYCYY